MRSLVTRAVPTRSRWPAVESDCFCAGILRLGLGRSLPFCRHRSPCSTVGPTRSQFLGLITHWCCLRSLSRQCHRRPRAHSTLLEANYLVWASLLYLERTPKRTSHVSPLASAIWSRIWDPPRKQIFASRDPVFTYSKYTGTGMQLEGAPSTLVALSHTPPARIT